MISTQDEVNELICMLNIQEYLNKRIYQLYRRSKATCSFGTYSCNQAKDFIT